MAVGERDPSDSDFTETATLIVNGRRFKNQQVYGDRQEPTRRDIFAPDIDGDLPERTKVRWQGRTYRARLSFRTSSSGSSIPVYTFNIQG